MPGKAKLNLILLMKVRNQIRKMQSNGHEGSSGHHVPGGLEFESETLIIYC